MKVYRYGKNYALMAWSIILEDDVMTHYKYAVPVFISAALLAVFSGCESNKKVPAPNSTDASSSAVDSRTIERTAEFGTTEPASTSISVTTSFVSGAAEYITTTVTKTASSAVQMPDNKTSFELPAEDKYRHAGETVSGQLVQSFSCDLTYDGTNEDVGKYYSQDKNKYFYRIYRKGKLMNTVISPENSDEQSSECTIVHDGNTGEYHLAWVNIKNDNVVLEYLDLSDNEEQSSTAVEFSRDNSDTYISGSKVSPEKCQQYLDNVTIIDGDERDLGSYLEVGNADQKPADTPADITPTVPEVPQSTTVDKSAEIEEIRSYYEKKIAEEQQMADVYKKDPRYNPALITAGTDAYISAKAAKEEEKELAERSGCLEEAAKIQDDIDSLDSLIAQTEYSIEVTPEVSRHEGAIAQYQQEMESKIASLQ